MRIGNDISGVLFADTKRGSRMDNKQKYNLTLSLCGLRKLLTSCLQEADK